MRIAALVLSLFALTTPVWGRQIEVPLLMDYPFVRQALVDKLYTTASGKAVLWDDGTGCGYLKLRDPEVSADAGRLRIVSRGEVRVGTAVGSQCLAPVQWDGFVEVLEEPFIAGDGRQLRFKVVASNLYDDKMKKGFFSGRVWDLVKENVQPSFETVVIDLRDVGRDLTDILPLVLAHQDATRLARLVESLQFVRASPTSKGIDIAIRFEVETTTPPAPLAEPTFSADELARWESGLQRWDAFLTFLIKRLWGDSLLPELRQPLVEVLLDSRYDLLDALAPETHSGSDPVRQLFLRAWGDLAPVLRDMASRQPGSVALRYFSFATAADALVALDAAGPEVGLDISADGLRRLARIVAPDLTADPLDYVVGVDPELRTFLGFGPPLDAPDLSGMPADELSWWRRLLLPAPAWADSEAPPSETLGPWLAERANIQDYLRRVHGVINDAAEAVLLRSPLPQKYHALYRQLVVATAWKESCWRQFVRQGGRITFLRSPVGAAGMMQVNVKVWRGLYDARGLRWDIKYNARAGAEIVQHYLSDYAIAKREDSHPPGIDNLARAAYAVYNGGPRHLSRYRKPSTKPLLRKIDEGFYDKYKAVGAGKALEVAKCIIGGE